MDGFFSRTGEKTFKSLLQTGVALIPRYLAVIAVGIAYLILRHHFDTLSIPDGLIRPAENPYYEFTGTKRILSYSLVLAVHIGKLFLADPIGFSHEYGFNCLPPVEDGLEDLRLVFPTVLFSVIILVSLSCLKKGLESSLLLAVGLSWVFTLLPISGVIKVGTFIADRIIVASTVTYAIFGGVFLTKWLHLKQQKDKTSATPNIFKIKIGSISCILILLGARVANRGFEWMDSLSLIQSSLKNCPNSAKSNLEMSKIYSGMYQEMFDMEKSL